MDHEHRRERALSRGLHQVAAHLARAAAGRRIVHVLRFDTLVGKRNRLRSRVARQQCLRHGKAAHRDRGRAKKELPPVDAAVAVLVVEVVNPLVDLRLGDRRHRFLLEP